MKQKIALLVCFLHGVLFSQQDKTAWFFRIEPCAHFGQFIGYEENYGELGVFIAPPSSGYSQFFVDLRGYLLEEGKLASSTGLGFRWCRNEGSSVWGTSLYYDTRVADYGHFNQLGASLEYLGSSFSIHLNGYWPLNAALSSKEISFCYPDGYAASMKIKNFAYSGVSAEASFPLAQMNQYTFCGGAGTYYYKNSEFFGICGGYARIELRCPRFFTLEALISRDSRFKTQVQGTVLLQIPFELLFPGTCTISPCCIGKLRQPVKRNGLVAFFKTCCDWDWNW